MEKKRKNVQAKTIRRLKYLGKACHGECLDKKAKRLKLSRPHNYFGTELKMENKM